MKVFDYKSFRPSKFWTTLKLKKGAISVMKIASSALASSPMTAVFPLFPFILSCLVLGVFIVAFFSLHTMPLELDNPSMQWLSDNVVAFKLTLLFCCVWHICFLTGLQKVRLSFLVLKLQ